MKRFVFFILLSWFISLNLHSNDIRFLEEFSFRDREKALKQLIPDSDEYYYYKCLDLQNSGKLEESSEFLAKWEKKYEWKREDSIPDILVEIRNRQALLSYDRTPSESLNYIKKYLGLKFNHKRGEGRIDELFPSAIKSESEKLMECLEKDKLSLHRFSTYGLRKLIPVAMVDKFEPKVLHYFLKNLFTCNFPHLPELIIKDLNNRKRSSKDSQMKPLKSYSWLLKTQLERCFKLKPEVRNLPEFAKAYIEKLRPPDSANMNAPLVRKAYLNRVLEFTKTLNSSYGFLKKGLLYNLLEVNLELGIYDKELFVEFLKIPENMVDYVDLSRKRPDSLVTYGFKEILPSLRKEFDQHLIDGYLYFFLKDASDYKEFSQWFDEKRLKKIFAEAKITHGGWKEKRYFAMLSEDEYKELQERVELEFQPGNKKYFDADDDVTLSLKIKNVDKLFVKVFVINQLNYYRSLRKSIDVNLDLEGVVPNFQKTYTYDESSFEERIENFSFPELKKRGVYEIDFIGNGKQCRALIQKGNLKFIEQVTAAGHIFTLFNEKGEVLKDTFIDMNGDEFFSDTKGNILIPFTSEVTERKIIISDGSTSSLAKFRHLSENYKLEAGFYLNGESVIAGKTAKLLISPRLLVNGCHAPVSLLKNVMLEVNWRGVDGSKRRNYFSNLKLNADKDFVFEFAVPENLNIISFILKGEVFNLSKNENQEVSAEDKFVFNSLDEHKNMRQVLLKPAPRGYFVNLLQKDGTKCGAGMDVSVFLRSGLSSYAPEEYTQYSSDENGRIYAGDLDGIEEFNLRFDEFFYNFTKVVHRDRRSYERMLNIPAEKEFSVPIMDFDIEKPLWRQVELIETRHSSPYRSMLDKVRYESAYLKIGGLESGTYKLRILNENKEITINVQDGVCKNGVIVGEERISEVSDTPELQIKEIGLKGGVFRIALANFDDSTRVHLFTSYFAPPYDCYEKMKFSLRDLTVKTFSRLKSRYLSSKWLSSEYRYILGRQNAKVYPGNMLERPELLLNPCDLDELLASDEDGMPGMYGARSANGRKGELKRYGGGRRTKSSPLFVNNLNFLADASPVFLNLKPDGDGMITIPKDELKGRQYCEVLAVDSKAVVFRSKAFDEKKIKVKDIRKEHDFASDKHYCEKKVVAVVRPGNEFVIANSKFSRFSVYSSLMDVFDYYNNLYMELEEFDFIRFWNLFTDEQKLDKYSKFACHELNFFIYKKDPAFFKKYIVDYLKNKRDKTFMDKYLLNYDLSEYMNLDLYLTRLNAVEKILLAERIGERKETLKFLRETNSSIRTHSKKWNELFKQALEIGWQWNESGMAALNGANEDVDENEEDEFDREADDERVKQVVGCVEGVRVTDNDILEYRENLDEFHNETGMPKLYAENNYYKLLPYNQYSTLIESNDFWVDYAKRKKNEDFISENFIESGVSRAEALLALSVFDLPFQRVEIKEKIAKDKMVLSSDKPFVVCCQTIREAGEVETDDSIRVGQTYFNETGVGDADEGQSVKDEFYVDIIYKCNVVVSNLLPRKRSLNVLLQIPTGAVPVNKGFYSETFTREFDAYSSRNFEYYFYFPRVGKFAHYPAQVFRDGEYLNSGKSRVINVVKYSESTDKTSWDFIAEHGSDSEIIKYLKEHNLQKLDFKKIVYKMKEKEFFKRVLEVLARQHVYNNLLWSYSVYHNSLKHIRQFIKFSELNDNCGAYFHSPLLDIDPVKDGNYEHYELKPVVNMRVYNGKDDNFTYPEVLRLYKSFLNVLKYKPRIGSDDLMELVYFLLLKGNIEEAVNLFAKIDGSKISYAIQYDYMKAYMSFYQEDIATAKNIAVKYKSYPIARWREKFIAILEQIKEINDTSAFAANADDNGLNSGNPEEVAIGLELHNQSLNLTYSNISECAVSYFPVDLELLFSKNPFIKDFNKKFAFVQPVETQIVELDSRRNSKICPIPAELKKSNLLIEVKAPRSNILYKTYIPNNMLLNFNKNKGYLIIGDIDGKRPVSKVYVKVYAEFNDGHVNFYKDGYTDLRGKFDYASSNFDVLEDVNRFSILVLSKEHGAVIQQVKPPRI